MKHWIIFFPLLFLSCGALAQQDCNSLISPAVIPLGLEDSCGFNNGGVLVFTNLLSTETTTICEGKSTVFMLNAPVHFPACWWVDTTQQVGEFHTEEFIFLQPGIHSVIAIGYDTDGGDPAASTLVVMVFPKDTTMIDTTTCDPALAGTQVQNLKGECGCDSIVITHTTLIPMLITTITTESPAPCEGEGEVVVLYPSAPIDNILWSTGETTPTIEVEGGTQVTATFFAEGFCPTTDSYSVELELCCDKAKKIFVPNAFSPNDDGINDIFYIQSKKDCIKNIKKFCIFDRWGNWVFQAYNFQPNDFSFGWDGYCRGKLMDTAVFAWFAEVEFVDGSVKFLKGDVTLVR